MNKWSTKHKNHLNKNKINRLSIHNKFFINTSLVIKLLILCVFSLHLIKLKKQFRIFEMKMNRIEQLNTNFMILIYNLYYTTLFF